METSRGPLNHLDIPTFDNIPSIHRSADLIHIKKGFTGGLKDLSSLSRHVVKIDAHCPECQMPRGLQKEH